MSARNEILQAIPAVAAGDGTFTVRQVVAEMARRGTGYSESTISTQVISRMCADALDNHATTFEADRLGTPAYPRVKIGWNEPGGVRFTGHCAPGSQPQGMWAAPAVSYR